jgi:rod shape-determining protein MreD
MYKRNIIVKWILYALLAFILTLLQEYVFSRIKIMGVAPILGGVITATIAMYEGGIAGGIFGAVLGYMCNNYSGGTEGLFAFMYLIGGFATGVLCEYMFRKKFITAFLWAAALTLSSTFVYFFIFFLIPGKAGVSALLLVGLPEVVYSVLLTPLVYFPVREIAKRSGAEEEI